MPGSYFVRVCKESIPKLHSIEKSIKYFSSLCVSVHGKYTDYSVFFIPICFGWAVHNIPVLTQPSIIKYVILSKIERTVPPHMRFHNKIIKTHFEA